MNKCLVFFVTLNVFLCSCQTVPITGRHGLMLVSVSQEREMGETSYRKTLSSSKISSDEKWSNMVKKVGRRLADAANRPDFAWEFNLIVEDKTINAWCLPGGKVAVYTGLLPVAKDEAGLAVVMGHEIAHALARHGAERMSQELIAQSGGAMLSIALSGQAAETQALFSRAYSTGVGVGALLPFSRSHESEADHIGLILMAKAGYNPQAAVEFWKRMSKATGGPGDGLQKYLSTHPSNSDRISQIESWQKEALANYHPN